PRLRLCLFSQVRRTFLSVGRTLLSAILLLPRPHTRGRSERMRRCPRAVQGRVDLPFDVRRSPPLPPVARTFLSAFLREFPPRLRLRLLPPLKRTFLSAILAP